MQLNRLTSSLLGMLLLAGCGGAPAPAAPAPVAADTAAAPLDSTPALTHTDTVRVRDPELDLAVSRMERQLLERDAQLEELRQRLDQAQREVVRTMARVQTAATRAEAASSMAEAELAVQALRSAAGAEGATDLSQARSLLETSTQEFGKANYGGARYLANQAKALASAARFRLNGGGNAGDHRRGEVAFQAVVNLQVKSRTNLREGPGTNFKILGTLERGARLTATGYVGEWLRVSDPAGRSGWVTQGLVSRLEPSGP